MNADNQQERSNGGLYNYIAGFVDGEGSFHIAIQRRNSMRLKWQLIPEFRVSQHKDRINMLRIIKKTFGCGIIKPNHRHTNDKNYVYVVRNRDDLYNKIIPFFEKFPLISGKNNDFKKFADIIRRMKNGEHLVKDEFEKMLKVAFSMNRKGKYRTKYNLDSFII